jgi:hypothetical protein
MGVSVSSCENRSQYSLIRPSVVLNPLCSSETLVWKMISRANQDQARQKGIEVAGLLLGLGERLDAMHGAEAQERRAVPAAAKLVADHRH